MENAGTDACTRTASPVLAAQVQAARVQVQVCRKAGLGNEPRKVFDEIAQIKVVDVVMPTKEGTTITKRCIAQPTKAQSILLQKLNLHLPQYMKTYPFVV